MRLTGLWAVAMLCIAAPASATTYRVATTGNDRNDGVTRPFLTLTKAVSVLKDGDTIQLHAGTYTGGMSIHRANITVESYPGELATISMPIRGKADNTLTLGAGAVGANIRNLRLVGGVYYALKIDGDKTDRRTFVDNCYIGESGRDCIKLTPGADGVTIRNCEIAKSGLRDASNAEGVDNVAADQMVVQDCYLHDIATNGIYPKGGARDAVIERTRIENCGGGGVMLGYWTDTEWFDPVENPNKFENINGSVRNCVIVNTKGAGIGLYSAQTPHVFNNTLVNVGQTMHAGILFSLGNTTQPCENAEVINNVVVQPAASTWPMVAIRAGSDDGSAQFEYNCYWKSGVPAVFEDNGQIGDLAAWQALGHDGTSFEENPLLSATYAPLPDSPLIGAGTPLLEVTDDFSGALRTSNPDIGAIQTTRRQGPGHRGVESAEGLTSG